MGNAAPAYYMCLPIQGGLAGPMYDYMLDRIVGSGRWLDCDALKPLASSVGLLEKGMPGAATAVDVGSNIGACTGYLLALGFQVHAIDPSRKHRDLLLGVAWEEVEAGRLVVHCALATDHSSLASEGAGDRCPRVRLDHLVAGVHGPLILKIDVDGGELKVLEGA